MILTLLNEDGKGVEIREMEEDEHEKIKQNKMINWDLNGIELEHDEMSCLMTDKDNYLVLYQGGRRLIYFVEWIKSNEMKWIDKIEMHDDLSYHNISCLSNSNDLIVKTGYSIHYIQFSSNSTKLEKTESKEYETNEFHTKIENEYLFVYGYWLNYMEMYKIEDLKRDRQLKNPTIIRIDNRIDSWCLSFESKYLMIGTKEKELIIYKMDNMNEPFVSIQLSESIWRIKSSGEYISILCGESSFNADRLISFKINDK